MPTNILRTNRRSAPHATALDHAPLRRALIRSGQVVLPIELLRTPTADLLWSVLPFHSTAERWGHALHFETPIEVGRDRTARALANAGDVYFCGGEGRVYLVFGATPISRGAELRLPRPCNVWARVTGNAAVFGAVQPGAKVALERDS